MALPNNFTKEQLYKLARQLMSEEVSQQLMTDLVCFGSSLLKLEDGQVKRVAPCEYAVIQQVPGVWKTK